MIAKTENLKREAPHCPSRPFKKNTQSNCHKAGDDYEQNSNSPLRHWKRLKNIGGIC